jgi:hypothetical protein
MRKTLSVAIAILTLVTSCHGRHQAPLHPTPLPRAILLMPSENRCEEPPPLPIHGDGDVLLQVPIIGGPEMDAYHVRLTDESGGKRGAPVWAADVARQYDDHTLLIMMPAALMRDRRLRLTVWDGNGGKRSSFTFVGRAPLSSNGDGEIYSPANTPCGSLAPGQR